MLALVRSSPAILHTMSFLAELKRRKIFKVTAAYVVIATPVIAFVDLTYDSLTFLSVTHQHLVKNLIVYLLAAGLPVAVVLSWLFDWTPEGIVRDTGPNDPASARVIAPAATADIAARPTSLRELISSGPMSISRLLRLAVRIADLLATDHANGKTHGSLNPGNVLVTADDRIELADLDEPQASKPSEAVERSAYLAPECAHGNAAEYRSDQFSFGAMLYEMATGRRAFFGTNLDETLAAVVHAAPEPVAAFNAEIPMPLQWTIERCLAKRPEDRYSNTQELKAELAAIAESAAAAISTRFVPKHNLPAQRTPLIGRQAELDAVKHLVLDKSRRLVTISGTGGIGKTRLLIELGRQLLERFKGGVYFVPLDRVQDADLVGSEIAKSLGVSRVPDHSVDETLMNHVRQHCVSPTLLLIDNFEHVLDAAPRVSELLAASEQIEIVVTSRAALRIYGEHEYRLPSLHIADSEATAEQLSESPAVRLFLECSVSLPENLDEESVRIVADICQRLDGLPLAIELAAARTRVLPLKGLLDRLQDPLELLAGGPRDLPARQQTLRATLEWSYRLLEDDLQKLFRRFGVFVGGATLEAIEAVCNVDEDLGINPMQAIESLVDNSLIRPMESEGPEPRFAMLETLREYALLQLAEAGEEIRTRRAHAAYCLVLAAESAQAQASSQWVALYDRFDLESSNMRAALDWLVETSDGDWGMKLASSLAHYWLQRAHVSEGYERLQQLLPLVEEGSAPLLWGLCWTGDFAAAMGRDGEALAHHLKGLEIARELDDVPAIIRGLNGVAVNTQQLGQLDRSLAYHEEAVRIVREKGGSPAVLGGMLSNYADNAILRGDFDLAQRLHEETLQIFIEAGDEPAVAWAMNRLGDVARRRGDIEAARTRYEQSLAIFREIEDQRGIAGCLYDLGGLLSDSEHSVESEQLNREALSIYYELGQTADFPRVVEALSRCALQSDDPGRALVLGGSAAAMRQTYRLGIRDAAQESVTRCIDAARKKLSDSEATTHWMTGWAMRTDQALAYALKERNKNLPEGL